MIERIAIDQDTEAGRAAWLKLRGKDVTASVAGALLGDHPYISAYELWCLKSGKVTKDPEDSPAMRRGRLMEPVAVEVLREERPTWTVQRNAEYFRDPAIRLGATPDVLAITEQGSAIVQIKSVEAGIFRKTWKEEGVVTPPLWISVQALVEAHLTGATKAYVAALVIGFGIDLHIIEIPLHAPLIKKIREKTVDFWHMVDHDMEPPVDYGRDLAVLQKIAMATNDGPAVDMSADNSLPALLDEKAALTADAKVIKDRQAEIKAELLHKLAGASSARVADGRVITSKTVQRSGYTVAPNSFRDLRVRAAKGA